MENNGSSQGEAGLAVIHFDIDRFKTVNNTVGFLDGNQVLGKIVNRFKMSLSPNEFIARVGGDEFIIVTTCEDGKEILQTGERFHSLFKEPFERKGYEFHITASIGIALYSDDSSTPEELLSKADTAMSYAKRSGKNQFVFLYK